MNILLTNDVGSSSPHFKALAARLFQEHEVWVFAPSQEQSACSHSITLRGPLAVKEEKERWYSCSGTPVDCVFLALKGYIPITFDLVISGINPGPNLGTDIIYSGTAAGAREGAILGKPSLAVSINSKNNSPDIGFYVEFIAKNLENLKHLWKPGCFININFPKQVKNNTHIEITIPGKRIYNDKLIQFPGPDGYTYCFFKGEPDSATEEGSDHYAVEANNISISLISVHPVHQNADKLFHTLSFWKGGDNK